MKLNVLKGGRARWSGLLALLIMMASLCTPWVASSSAQAGGADKPRPASFGDCKHQNAGVHNGYDCEEEEAPEGGGTAGAGGGGTAS